MRWLLFLVLLPRLLAAQGFDFYDRGPYRPQVPRPDSLLGHPIGTRQTMYHEQQEVLDRMLAAAPDRSRTEEMGTTWEGKRMRLLIISAPEHLARLEEIRANLARLADPRRTSPAEARALARRTPVTVLLTHSVHGNEPAGFETALQTAYQLLASDEPATREILRHTVVLINPAQNPDGHERFAAWSNSVAVGSDDPAALEQTEPWSVEGRSNHYRFDLNRDLLALSQPESQALARVYRRWHPQVVCDLHSTAATYFFPPVAPATNQNLPDRTYEWFERFGRNNAEAFDRRGWQYYVRDIFDFFYPGYVDTWASMRGGIGMTYETDGGPELRKRKDDGSLTTLQEAIAHHYVASLATLEYAAAHGEERLLDFYDFHASVRAEVARRPLRRIVFGPGPDGDLAWRLAGRLVQEGIEVIRLGQPYTAPRATSYLGGTPSRRSFPAGSFVVDLAQPEGRLATAILEPRAGFDSAFVARQLARYARNQRRDEEEEKESYGFYDVTAWSLPLAWGLDAWWTDDTSQVTGSRVAPDESSPVPPEPGRARSAYVFANSGDGAVRLALRLLAEGYRLAAATQPLVADGAPWPRGTFVVRVQRNPESLHQRIAELARETGTRVAAIRSAFADTGQAGVGSQSVVAVRHPRILLAAGRGVDQAGFGDVWFYLERELGLAVTPLHLRDLRRTDLDRYNVVILPDGSADQMWSEIGDSAGRRLRAWVEAGGAMVGVGGAVRLLARPELQLTTVATVGDSGTGPDTARTQGPTPPLVSPTARGGNSPEFIPGAIFRATLDRTHWLTAGYERDELPVFLRTSTLLRPSKRGANPVAFTGSELALSGITWPDNTDRFVRHSTWAAVETVGEGRVILFAESPVYRALWRGTARLLANAILQGPGR